MAKKSVPPSTEATAFDCPHCGAYTKQTWYNVHAYEIEERYKTPNVFKKYILSVALGEINELLRDPKAPRDEIMSLKREKEELAESVIDFFSYGKHDNYVINAWLAKCDNCERLSIWGIDSLLYPYQKEGIPPNEDMPQEIQLDYDEARSIVCMSPRGAAALLRLSIQKLCIYLGERGKDLNSDIGNLVKKGLDPMIIKALDVVRVIGGQAVHPGVIDLKDDYQTVLSLFDLINLIVEQMISYPKKINRMHDDLPSEKKEAIKKRDAN